MIRKKSTNVVIGNSHVNHLLKTLKHNNKVLKGSYHGFPGFKLTCENHFEQILDTTKCISEKNDIRNLTFNFGCNEAHDIAEKLFFNYSWQFEIVQNKLKHGICEQQVKNGADPLDIIKYFDTKFLDFCNKKFNIFFERLDKIKNVLAPQQTKIVTPGPRYMFGSPNNIKYLMVAYYLSHQIFEKYGESNNVINPFLHEWCCGINEMFLHDCHDSREVSNVLNNGYSRYGAVHYNDKKYLEINNFMSRGSRNITRTAGNRVKEFDISITDMKAFPIL